MLNCCSGDVAVKTAEPKLLLGSAPLSLIYQLHALYHSPLRGEQQEGVAIIYSVSHHLRKPGEDHEDQMELNRGGWKSVEATVLARETGMVMRV